MLLKEIISSFEGYLKTMPETVHIVKHPQNVCKLLPIPGGFRGMDFKEPTDAFVKMVGTSKNSRVFLEDGEPFLWPMSHIVGISSNPRHGEELRRIPRSLFRVYQLNRDFGYQIEEISRELEIGESTAHAWVSDLEECFREWWVQSPKIPKNVKWLAKLNRQCPVCKEDHFDEEPMPEKESKPCRVVTEKGLALKVIDFDEGESESHSWCEGCGRVAIDEITPAYLVPYPWGSIAGTHEILEKRVQNRPSSTKMVHWNAAPQLA